jgi:WD40 repeat protein
MRTATIRTFVLVALVSAGRAGAAPPNALPPGAVSRLGTPRQFASPRLAIAAYSADGKRLVVAAGEYTLHCWGQPDQPQHTLLRRPDSTPSAFALSPDGRSVAVGCTDGSVHLRETATGKTVLQLTAHDRGVQAVAFAPDGKRFATIDDAGQVARLWRDNGEQLGACISRNDNDGEVLSLAFAGDRLLLGRGDGTVEIWGCAGPKQLRTVRTGRPVRTLAVTRDGSTAFAEGEGHVLVAVEIETGRTLQTFEGHSGAIVALSCAARGIVVSSGVDGGVRVWDTATGEELQRLYADGNAASSLALAPDGRTLVVANPDRSVDRWDLGRTAFAPLLVGHGDEVEAVVFTDSGRTVRTWSGDTAFDWKAATGKRLGTTTADKPPREKLVTSPGGKYRVTVDHEQALFPILVSTETGKEVPLDGTLRSIRAAAFSPDDKLLAAAGSDGNVTLWETLTGQVLVEFKAHEERVNCVAFAPDGRSLATGGDTVLVWSLTACGPVLSERWRDPADDDLESMWKALSGEAGEDGFAAMRGLVASPKKAVPFLRSKLPTALDLGRIKMFLKQLDDDEFEKREKASQELERMGRDAEQALRTALAGKPSAEVKRRIEELLSNLTGDDSPRERCWSRAVFVLEQIGTPEARAVLKLLAEGDRVPKAAEDARGALKRTGG